MTGRPWTIAVLPGDGIGPEVTAAARAVLEAVAERFGHRFELLEGLIGGAAIDVMGEPLPLETTRLCRRANAVLLGAVGGPRWDPAGDGPRPEQGLLDLRQALGLFANIRPVRAETALADVSPLKREILDGVDLVVVRELTGGIYFGDKRREGRGPGERAIDLCAYTAHEIARVTRVAARLALRRRGRVTSVDKANVLETSRLWREVVSRVVETEFPGLQLDHLLVDACAMQLVRRPASFDVILTENMFGDILTDEAAVLAGSIGLLPSASLGNGAGDGPAPGLYEPIHGSAPDIAGRGVANPVGAILSAAMLLRWSLGLPAEADAVEMAVQGTLAEGEVTPDLAGPARAPRSTAEVVAGVLQRLETPVPAGPAR